MYAKLKYKISNSKEKYNGAYYFLNVTKEVSRGKPLCFMHEDSFKTENKNFRSTITFG